MAYKKDIKPLLKELGYTWEQMQAFWDECIEINFKIKALANSGKNWNDLPLHLIKELPTLKETTLRQQEEEEYRKEQEALEQEKRKADEKYYNEHFDEIVLSKIDSKIPLTGNELSTLVYEYAVDRENGENRRWTRSVYTVIELLGRYFQICWEEGLTECQENEFLEQPIEVVKHTYEKTIVVTEWRKV